MGLGFRIVLPVEFGLEQLGPGSRYVDFLMIVWPASLQQEDCRVGIFREAASYNTACGPCAYHDIVMHRLVLLRHELLSPVGLGSVDLNQNALYLPR